MIVYENPFIKMDYDPATDILVTQMPDVDTLILPEINRFLGIIVEQVRNYDVKKLLVDARKTQVEVNEETYSAMMSDFLHALLSTHLQKLARIVSSSTVRESAVKNVYTGPKLPIQLQSFTDITSAIDWLKE
ncbi:hypothetical protein [Adhaeribacter aquaticus]|uniref:hypothetical protein n=1 Tax=Adhaeribacter aquaticus TaxID=299567 RepID=UPI00047CEF9A|nr:hypothetical protein [Adhaeribacter aquaticus]